MGHSRTNKLSVSCNMSAETRFGPFVLQRQQGRLLANGKPVSIGSRAFEVLTVLVDHPGQLVTKSQLFDLVWPGVVVEENNLQVHVSSLRKVLGADLIATVPGRGYRFTGAIAPDPASPEPDLALAVALQPRPSRRPAMAVLPFANLSGQESQEYFSDGLAEDIIAQITQSSWLLVIARNSSFHYRASTASPQTICRELGVRYLVTGSVRRAENKVRVSAELVDGITGDTLWAQRYDRPVEDLFAVQADISHQMVCAIEPVFLRREEQQSSASSGRDMQHWDMLMRARWHFWRSSKTHIEEAQRLLGLALVLKADDAPSLALMAFTHMAQVWAGNAPDPKMALTEANRLAMTAVQCDDQDSYAHFTLGTALSCVGQMDRAIAELERALAIYPQFAAASGELGRLLAFSGRTEEAVEQVLQAIDTSPHDQHLSLWVRTRAIACFIDGNHADAIKFANLATSNRPGWFFNHYMVAACQAAGGNIDAAKTAYQEASKHGSYSMGSLRFGHPFVNPEHMNAFVGALREAGWQG